MNIRMPRINRRYSIISLSYTILFNTIIAILLSAIGFGGDFISNLIISQCIGISMCSSVLIAMYLLKPNASPLIQLAFLMGAFIPGSVLGLFLGSFVIGEYSWFFHDNSARFFQSIFLAMIFGSVICYFFMSREKISAAKTLIREERLKTLTAEKEKAETNLRLLQAQIEPHFLFNTLSNILSLIDTDTGKARSMMVDFIRYLRMSLSKTREDITTIGQELDIIRAYINIFKVRMGERLSFRIDIADDIKGFPFPPMLIQPLVENAIQHGLEPGIEGGDILIKAIMENDVFRLEVADTGPGFREGSEAGIGLSNVRERLSSLYGDRARLILEENKPSGLKAIIEVKDEPVQGDYR